MNYARKSIAAGFLGVAILGGAITSLAQGSPEVTLTQAVSLARLSDSVPAQPGYWFNPGLQYWLSCGDQRSATLPVSAQLLASNL
jgi:hypothetical protein